MTQRSVDNVFLILVVAVSLIEVVLVVIPDRCVISNFVARPAQQFDLYSLWYQFDPLCVVDSFGIALEGSCGLESMHFYGSTCNRAYISISVPL